MKCRLCGTPFQKACCEHRILNRYEVKYYQCSQCNLLQTEFPYWLDIAYSDSINTSDTGLVSRNLYISKFLLALFISQFGLSSLKNLNCVDLGGGYGLLVRLMRDIGINFYWSDKYTKNLLANGFEDKSLSYDAAVSFEVLEHLVDIDKELSSIFDKASFFVFSTTLYEKSIPSKNWNYYGFSHGQHINFFSTQTLEYISSKYSLNYISDGKNFHVFSRYKLSKTLILRAKFLSNLPLKYLARFFVKSKLMSDHDYMLGG